MTTFNIVGINAFPRMNSSCLLAYLILGLSWIGLARLVVGKIENQALLTLVQLPVETRSKSSEPVRFQPVTRDKKHTLHMFVLVQSMIGALLITMSVRLGAVTLCFPLLNVVIIYAGEWALCMRCNDPCRLHTFHQAQDKAGGGIEFNQHTYTNI